MKKKKLTLWQTINWGTRSAIFTFLMFTLIMPYSIFCVCLWPFPLRVRGAAVSAWARFILWLLKVICQIHYKIEGLENIPKDRNGVVLSKHQSTYETLVIPTLFPDAAFIMKKELLWIPFFGWGAATMTPIAITRASKSSAMAQIIKKGTKYLKQGRWIIVFPEGTRTATGEVGNYRLGGTRLAVHADYPVLPIAHNAGRVWPRRQFIKIPGTVTFVIGPLIESKDQTPEELLAVSKSWIESTMQRIDSKPHN